MLSLRPYQRAAIDAVYDYWRTGGGNPLVDLATGTGKSLVAASLVHELLAGWPDMRIGVVTHVKELIRQNAAEMLKLWPGAPIGINSAGLGRRDTRSQVLFCGIQSVHNKISALGKFDLLIVDEAHLIPRDGETRYGRFIADCRAKYADMRVLGLTATRYRLDSGLLDQGDGRLFDRTVFVYGIADGIRDGYLAPLISHAAHDKIDVSGVEIRGGEFLSGDLQAKIFADDHIAQACGELVAIGNAQGRSSWLVFCAGVAHAHTVSEELNRLGVSCAPVTGETPAGERDRLIEQFGRGHIRALTSVGVLTTGFNVPRVDLIAMMRPTLSTGLYVQMVGRGTRQAVGKENCLVLDFAGNIRRHGPVDDVSVEAKGGGKSEPVEKVKPDTVRAKECPECMALVGLSAKSCPACGYTWPVKHEATPDREARILSAPPEWHGVEDMQFYPHSKPGKPRSMRIEYLCKGGLMQVAEWLCFNHEGFAAEKARQTWKKLGGELPAPKSTEDALDRADELGMPSALLIKTSGKFKEIVSRRMGAAGGNLAGSLTPPPSVAPAMEGSFSEMLDDEIPF